MEVFKSSVAGKTLSLDALNRPILDESESPWGSMKNLLLTKDRNELDTFKKNYKTKFTATLSKGDKVFFGKTSFPSLLLSRINDVTPTGLKRVAKADNADKYVVDPDLISFFDTSGIVVKVSDDDWYYLEINPTYMYKDKLFKKLQDHLEYEVYWAQGVHNIAVAEAYLDPGNKVTTWEFIKYISQFTPTMTQTEKESIFAMLKCANDEDYKAAVDMLQYYNILPDLGEIMETLRSSTNMNRPSRNTSSGMSSAGKYLFYVLGMSPSELYGISESTYWRVDPNDLYTAYNDWQKGHPMNPTLPDLTEIIITRLVKACNDDYYTRRDMRETHSKLAVEPDTGQASIQCQHTCTYAHNRAPLIKNVSLRYQKVLDQYKLKFVLYDE